MGAPPVASIVGPRRSNFMNLDIVSRTEVFTRTLSSTSQNDPLCGRKDLRETLSGLSTQNNSAAAE